MFDLDTIYLFKYENKDDRTLYTSTYYLNF